MNTQNKLSILEKISYGVGDMGCNFIWFLVAISSVMFGVGAIITNVATIICKFIVMKYGKKKTWMGCFILSSVVSAMFC